jgi:hypothetical protein
VGVLSQAVSGGGIFLQGFPDDLLAPLFLSSAVMLQYFGL